MALGQKYFIGDNKTSMYFWANSDKEAISFVKHHKFTINKDTQLTNRTSKKSIKINEN